MPKADKTEYEKRIAAVQNWIVDGESTSGIVANITGSGWCTSERHARRIIAAATKRWAANEATDMREKRKIAAERLRKIIKTMPEDVKNTPAGLKTILDYEKEINKLDGIIADKEPPSKVVININEEF